MDKKQFRQIKHSIKEVYMSYVYDDGVGRIVDRALDVGIDFSQRYFLEYEKGKLKDKNDKELRNVFKRQQELEEQAKNGQTFTFRELNKILQNWTIRTIQGLRWYVYRRPIYMTHVKMSHVIYTIPEHLKYDYFVKGLRFRISANMADIRVSRDSKHPNTERIGTGICTGDADISSIEDVMLKLPELCKTGNLDSAHWDLDLYERIREGEIPGTKDDKIIWDLEPNQ